MSMGNLTVGVRCSFNGISNPVSCEKTAEKEHSGSSCREGPVFGELQFKTLKWLFRSKET